MDSSFFLVNIIHSLLLRDSWRPELPKKKESFVLLPKVKAIARLESNSYLGRLTTPWGSWAPYDHTTPRFPEAMYLRQNM